jgi:protein TonB
MNTQPKETAMNATSSYQNGGNKITKIAIVTLLHAGVALALLQMRIVVPHEKPQAIDVSVFKEPVHIEPTPTSSVEKLPTLVPPVFVPPTIITESTPTPPVIRGETRTLTTGDPGPVIRGETPPAVPPPVIPAAKPVFQAATAGNCAIPNYPAASARNGDTGTVGLALLIAPDGHVADSKITSTSGFRELDRAAVAALSMCKFKPASTNGVPEAAWGKIAYIWSLE